MTVVAGTRVTEQLEVGGAGGDTVASLAVRLAGIAGWTTVTATTIDARETWRASVLYDPAGVWYRRWTVTGTGAGERTDEVLVGPRAGDLGDDNGPTYATGTELAAYLGTAPPADAMRLLARAGEFVDRLLLCARYPVDADGMPTEAGHIRALRKATCQQVKWWIDTGDPTGAGAVFQSVSIGGVSLSRGYTSRGSATGSDQRIAPDALATLTLAGLAGQQPVVIA